MELSPERVLGITTGDLFPTWTSEKPLKDTPSEKSGKDRHPVNIVTNVGDIGADQYRGMRVKVINQWSRVRRNYQGSLFHVHS